MNNESQSLLSQFSNHQLQQLRRAPTLEEKEQLITKFKLENAQAQEVQRQLDEVRNILERIRKPSARFGSQHPYNASVRSWEMPSELE